MNSNNAQCECILKHPKSIICILDLVIFYINSECMTIGKDTDRPFEKITINEHELDFSQVTHQLFHVLGRCHEHQREDRDDYVEVKWENIKEGTMLDIRI